MTQPIGGAEVGGKPPRRDARLKICVDDAASDILLLRKRQMTEALGRAVTWNEVITYLCQHADLRSLDPDVWLDAKMREVAMELDKRGHTGAAEALHVVKDRLRRVVRGDEDETGLIQALLVPGRA